jgi:hypothetical protein
MALVAVSILSLSGCVQIASIPYTAHSGDTVVLGLGGIKRNWQGEAPANLQVVITDSASNSYDLGAQTVFQAYPDYRSGMNVAALDPANPFKLDPFDGGWFISVPLVDDTGAPLILATGSATISVTGTNLVTRLDDLGQLLPEEGNLAEIPLEIIAGPPATVNSNAQFDAYASRGTYFLVRPTGTTAATIGGAYYVIDYQSDAAFSSPKPMVLPVAHNPYINIDYEIRQNGDGSGSYHISVLNRAGFVAATPRQEKQTSLQDLGVYLEYLESLVPADVKANFELDAAHSYYIDIDGNKVSALVPEMVHAEDL